MNKLFKGQSVNISRFNISENLLPEINKFYIYLENYPLRASKTTPHHKCLYWKLISKHVFATAHSPTNMLRSEF